MSVINEDTNVMISDYRVVIKIMNLDNGKSRIHRYTDFMNKWMNSATNTANNVAGYIVPFLNYIHFELSITELSSIEDLSFEHGIAYLELKAKNGGRCAVLQCESILKEFYYFLVKKNLLHNIKKSDFTFIEMKNGNRQLESPFKGKYKLPPKKKQNKLHQIDDSLIFELLLTALQTSPQISLGLYFQIFGGLRVSEVVNLKYTNVHLRGPFGRDGMVLVIEASDLRRDLKQNAITVPKKPRNQVILPVKNLLGELYKSHRTNFIKPESNAIFIDTRGKPMSKSTYTYHFGKVKDRFIKKLKESDNPEHKLYATFLNTKNWSTHIGRGIFSAIITDVANNASEIAVMRGDSDLRSALSYLSDSRRLEIKAIQNLNDFYSEGMINRFLATLKG